MKNNIAFLLILFFTLLANADQSCLKAKKFYWYLNADKAFNCGKYFMKKDSDAVDFNSALSLMTWSYQQGNKNAATEIAWILYTGYGSLESKTADTSERYCKKQNESLNACQNFVWSGSDFPILPDCKVIPRYRPTKNDLKKAFDLSKESADYGNLGGMVVHGWLAEWFGYDDQAIKYYRLASELHNSIGTQYLALLFAGYRSSFTFRLRKPLQWMSILSTPEWADNKALSLLHDKAMSYAPAAIAIARKIMNTEPEEAAKICIKINNPDSKYLLGLILEKHPHLYSLPEKQAAESNDVQQYDDSIADKVLQLFEDASDQLHEKASFKAGHYHEHGLAGNKLESKAMYRYCIGFANGDMSSGVALANLLSEKLEMTQFCHVVHSLPEKYHSELLDNPKELCQKEM